MRTRLEKFLAKTRKTRGCWWWLGSLTVSEQRARMAVGSGKWQSAAQIAYELFKGPRNGLQVLHTCDNPQCVNPKHLFLGTPLINAQDRERKGRGKIPRLRGEASPLAKLTKAQVRKIRQQYQFGNGAKLAREYGITRSYVSEIILRKVWKHV